MISERLFCRSYPSFWRDLLPFSEVLIRDVNRKWGIPPADKEEPVALTRAIANEGSVRLFRRMAGRGGAMDPQDVSDAIAEAASWLGAADYQLTKDEVAEVGDMAAHLHDKYRVQALVFGPRFRGCGLLHECEGDLIADTTLVEVKSGHRAFRSPDLRQLLTYAALNSLTRTHDIDSVELCNARLRRDVRFDLEALCVMISGESSVDIFGRIADFLVGGIVSGV